MHYSCLVIVPEGEDPEATVKALMEPHSEHDWMPESDEDDRPDNYWWDWYRIGGRWDGHFLDLESLSEDTHYTDAWTQLSRNSALANMAGEWDTYRVLSPEGSKCREFYNPEWTDNGYPADVEPTLPTPDYMQWRAEQLVKYRDGVVVVVDYHS